LVAAGADLNIRDEVPYLEYPNNHMHICIHIYLHIPVGVAV
jgi:hypothetical protein